MPPARLLVPLEPLTPDTFLPYGSVIQNPLASSLRPQASLRHIAPVTANQGSARKFADMSRLDSFYGPGTRTEAGRGAISLFECRPRETTAQAEGAGKAFGVGVLERHPYTTQTFCPLGLPAGGDTRYLVIVAPTLPSPSASSQPRAAMATDPPSARKGTGPPDLQRTKAFLARGDQAVTYAAGTWHAPMVVLGARAVDFVVVQFVNGVPLDDCQERDIPEGAVVVDLRGMDSVWGKAKL